MITQLELKELLSYNQDTGIFTWNVNRSGGAKSGDIAGSIHHEGYIRIQINKKIYAGHRLAWLYVHGYFPENKIDHINGNTSDNKITNLRTASDVENARNRKIKSTNISGFKGVSKHLNMWRARYTANNKTYNLGLFETKELARQAYESATLKEFGDFHYNKSRINYA
jgi:hypothetical protein